MFKQLLLLLIFGSLAAQSITNVRARQEGLEIIITYDLTGELNPKDEIIVGYSTDNGETYTLLTHATGDLGSLVTPGKHKTISWFVPDQFALGKTALFRVSVPHPVIPGMVFIEGGTFQMGSNKGYSDERPVRTVTVRSFYMDKTEVTQWEFRRVMGKNPSSFTGCDDCPVERVTWFEATEYAKKVGKRLPTEAEWEYAARGSNQSRGLTYAGSNDLNAVGWYDDNSGNKTHPVAQKQPNELGLYDLSGNVWEWCADWYSEDYYQNSPALNPTGPASGKYRVLRGGSWSSSNRGCRAVDRIRDNPKLGGSGSGFRCDRDP